MSFSPTRAEDLEAKMVEKTEFMTPPFVYVRECQMCGAPLPRYDDVCIYCGMQNVSCYQLDTIPVLSSDFSGEVSW
jgi:hypothetical protein